MFTMQYHRTLKQMAVATVRRLPLQEQFLAVNDVSFTVEQGESIGLMGLNGSGKSTLLKLINGVMRPDTGTIRTRGRIAGLIATGAGFHPQLTGRENLFLNGAILGMSEAETKRKFDEIVDFADIGKFLDTPVSHYSSGMYARLGFSIAIHVDADIFLADEVLAVGDRPFKKKCMAKMQEIRQQGTTIFYVSHATASVRVDVRPRAGARVGPPQLRLEDDRGRQRRGRHPATSSTTTPDSTERKQSDDRRGARRRRLSRRSTRIELHC